MRPSLIALLYLLCAKENLLDIPAFVEALRTCAGAFHWTLEAKAFPDHVRYLRGWQHIPGAANTALRCDCAVSAVAYATVGMPYSLTDWNEAAIDLDLTPEDAIAIIRAADGYSLGYDQTLRKAILDAVGLEEDTPHAP